MTGTPLVSTAQQALRAREADAIAAVSGPRLMAYTRDITRWVRLSGEPDERRAFEYVEGVLRGLGLRTQLLEHDAFISLPGPARLRITSPVRELLPCITHAFAAPTGADGVQGELVYVGQGTAEDYARVDVRGKVALVEGLGIGGKVRRGEERGAIAQVFIHGEYTHETSVSPLWGPPTPETAHLLPRTPSFSVNRAAGARLKDLLAQGPVRVRAWGEVTTGWRMIPLLVADLPGQVEPDRFVLLSSHLDSWHYGAMDNGAANATLLEAIRVLVPGPRRRSLRVAFWSGHSHGRFAGSSWYADHFWFDLYRHCVAHVNSDSTGGRGATVLEEAPVMAETRALAAEFIRTIGGQDLRGKRIGRFADQSFVGVGVPSVFGTFSEQDVADPETRRGLSLFEHAQGRAAGLGWWWHTTEDTLDKVDEAFLVRDTQIYTGVIFRLLNEPALPLEYGATAREIRDLLTRYQTAARGQLDLSAELDAARALEARTGDLRRALAAAAAAGDETRLRVLNDTVMRLGRLLVPVNYTLRGPFEHDLGTALPPLPGLAQAEALGTADPQSAQAKALYVALRRQANRVRFALEEASAIIEAVI
ncbi:MAG: M28 family peptidase [Armatimonadota bacterium]|nr:M28 family peptidase [Armatimonadota bacterium]MDR7487011.1 M28 family peptidase [Armatimonadota bacterium]MDR7533411.1 M28 family peptidase [Armatimonadota bacterium]MDR7535221.1 M28 family peptidase [Armatimonadota bacterium]